MVEAAPCSLSHNSLPEVMSSVRYFYCVASGVLIISTVLLNSISVLTIWKCSYLKAKLCYFLILTQSLVDLGVGLISLPLYIVYAAVELRGAANCVDGFVLQAVYRHIPVGTSFMTIYLLTFERYLIIVHPVIQKTQVLIYVCWAAASVIVGGPALTVISAVRVRIRVRLVVNLSYE